MWAGVGPIGRRPADEAPEDSGTGATAGRTARKEEQAASTERSADVIAHRVENRAGECPCFTP